MLPYLSSTCNRLRAAFHRPRAAPSAPAVDPPPDDPLPLAHPEVPLPAWVAQDPVVQKYRALLGMLPWQQFPERPTDRPWPGPQPDPRAPFVAAFLVKLHEDKQFMSQLRAYLVEHPALVWWLGFPRVADPAQPQGFDVARTVPTRRQFSRVLRTLPNATAQFLLTATVQLLQTTLTPDQQPAFGDVVAGDTQAILAWVKQNNPKVFIEGRLDKQRQPTGDPDCKLGVKRRGNQTPSDVADFPTPSTDAKPASPQIGVDVLWGYATGIVVTRLPDHTEVVLAERTRPFNEPDVSYFFPLMQQVEQRLGRRPRFGVWDAAFDAHYVYDYFHQAGGLAAVPYAAKRGGKRQFSPDGHPKCAAGLTMAFEFTYLDRKSTLVVHQRAKYRCPLLFPQASGEVCPLNDEHFAKGGCETSLANTPGARIRHELDRTSERYRTLYTQRTMVERINSQAEALGMQRPKLRRGSALVNRNTLTYVLINLRALARLRGGAEVRSAAEGLTLAA